MKRSTALRNTGSASKTGRAGGRMGALGVAKSSMTENRRPGRLLAATKTKPAPSASKGASTSGRVEVSSKPAAKSKSADKSATKSKLTSTSSTTKGDKIKDRNYIHFAEGKAEGSLDDRNLLGGKGAGLCDMSSAGIPVPPGFVISTEVCSQFYESGLKVPSAVDKKLEQQVERLEKISGSTFGDPANPLLLSVRSGSVHSMPGMMDTILNLGLNQKTLDGLSEKTGDARFAHDNYRRLIQMFGNVVLGIDRDLFEDIVTKIKKDRRVKIDSALQVKDLKDIISRFRSLIKRKSGEQFPDDVYLQLRMARDAVFRSWNNPRAISYRRMNDIPSDLGTAVTVQVMVFGNSGSNSGTGVGFTRNPSTGEKVFFGEYLSNAQGEDVVAGVRTPSPIAQMAKEMPAAFKKLKEITLRLEKRYRDVQDFEFTVEHGKLYMLQTRTGKRTTQAAVKIAVDMANEKLITREEALMRINPADLDNLLHPHIDTSATYEVIAKGLPASPGAASGLVCFTAEDAKKMSRGGRNTILVRQETSPDDIEGMEVAAGILTSRGGMTSHAAVVARGMGTCCVAGAEMIRVSEKKKQFHAGKKVIKEGDIITLNGSTGEVILGEAPTIEPELTGEFTQFMEWCDDVRRLDVRANADTPRDAKKALEFGAVGIGLCRTEHMFFAEDRFAAVQEMIIADDAGERQTALDKILPFQKQDFKAIFDVMKGRPVTIRTLDPPLHEFLPKREAVVERLETLDKREDDYDELLVRLKKTIRRIDELEEQNPMLGHRGCRLGIIFPEITEMQARAILEAACELTKAKKPCSPEIMIPLVGTVNEFIDQRDIIHAIARETMSRYKIKELNYKVGTMIEIPRAALTADEIAVEADFFSFGTNDLTQMTMGFSRDDVAKFLPQYVERGILPFDPFVSIDERGVGQLVEMGAVKGRKANPNLKVGICGEHGGDPKSIAFCHKLGLDYVSCSPYRVPIARLAGAQISIQTGEYRKPENRISKTSAKAAAKKATKKVSKTAAKTAAKTASKSKSAAKTAVKKSAAKKSPVKKVAKKK